MVSPTASSHYGVALSSPYEPKASLVGDDDHDLGDSSGEISPPSYVDRPVHVQPSNSNIKRGDTWEMVTSPPEVLLTPTSTSYRTAGPPPGFGISLDATTPIAGPSNQHRHELHPMLMNYVRVTLLLLAVIGD